MATASQSLIPPASFLLLGALPMGTTPGRRRRDALRPIAAVSVRSSMASSESEGNKSKLLDGCFPDSIEGTTEFISCSKAHARMFADQGFITTDQRIYAWEILDQFAWTNDWDVQKRFEMVREQIEKICTARSRNHQIIMDPKMWLQDAIDKIPILMKQFQGLIKIGERDTIMEGLDQIEKLIGDGEFESRKDREDVQKSIKATLVEMVEPAEKLRTARSRSDQIVLDCRLWYQDVIEKIPILMKQFQGFIMTGGDITMEGLDQIEKHIQDGIYKIFIAIKQFQGVITTSGDIISEGLDQIEKKIQDDIDKILIGIKEYPRLFSNSLHDFHSGLLITCLNFLYTCCFLVSHSFALCSLNTSRNITDSYPMS